MENRFIKISYNSLCLRRGARCIRVIPFVIATTFSSWKYLRTGGKRNKAELDTRMCIKKIKKKKKKNRMKVKQGKKWGKIEIAGCRLLYGRTVGFLCSFATVTNCSSPHWFCFDFNYLSLHGPHCTISGREFDTRCNSSFRSRSIRFITASIMRGHHRDVSIAFFAFLLLIFAFCFSLFDRNWRGCRAYREEVNLDGIRIACNSMDLEGICWSFRIE